MKGKNGTTSFLPLDSKKGGPVRYVRQECHMFDRRTNEIYL